MEIQQNFEVNNEQGIGIDGLAGAGVVEQNYISDDDIEIVSSLKDDQLSISSASSDNSSVRADIKSVKKILLSQIEQEEGNSYILNDDIMALLEAGAIEIDQAINEFLQAQVGLGQEVNTLIDEFNNALEDLIKDHVSQMQQEEDVVSVLAKIVDAIAEFGVVDDSLSEEVAKIEDQILFSIESSNPVVEEEVDLSDVFTAEVPLFEDFDEVAFEEIISSVELEVLEVEENINEEDVDSYISQRASVIENAEQYVAENTNAEIIDAIEPETDQPDIPEEPKGVGSQVIEAAVSFIVDQMQEQEVLKADSTEEEVAQAIYDYIIDNKLVSLVEDNDGLASSLKEQGISIADMEEADIVAVLYNAIVPEYISRRDDFAVDASQFVIKDGVPVVNESLESASDVNAFEQLVAVAFDGSENVDISSFIDSTNPAVLKLANQLKSQNVITDDMTEDEIAVAIYNYVLDNYEYISDDESGLAWQTANSTIDNGYGDCEDLTILYVNLCLAAGISEEKMLIYVEAGTEDSSGHVVVGYTSSSGQQLELDLTKDISLQSTQDLNVINPNKYMMSFSQNVVQSYSFSGETIIFEDPGYVDSMYTAADSSAVPGFNDAATTISAVFNNSYATYMGHVQNLINYQENYIYDIPLDMSGVAEAPAAFMAGNYMDFQGVNFDAMVEQFLAIKIQIYIMMACIILFNEIMSVKTMLINFLFDYQYEVENVLSSQRVSNSLSSAVGQLDQLISNALADVQAHNQDAYEYNQAEIARIAKEEASKVDSKKADAYENMLVSAGNLELTIQYNGVNDSMLTACEVAIKRLSEVTNDWENDHIWQKVLDGRSVDSNLQISAEFDTMVMSEQSKYALDTATMDVSSLVLKVLFGIDSRDGDRANIASISAAFRSAEKAWITRYSNFLKVEKQLGEQIKLAQKQYEDAKRVWDSVKDGPGFFGSILGIIVMVIVVVVAVVITAATTGAGAALAVGLIGLAIGAGLYTNAMLQYQKDILETMEYNLENDISLNYDLLTLDWTEPMYGGRREVGEILSLDNSAVNMGNQLDNLVSNAWGLVTNMSNTGQIDDLNAQLMGIQCMLLAMLAIVDAMADARGAVMQVLFNVQTKVDMMQVLQTWVNGTFANINSAFDYNSSMLFSQAQEHNRKLQVEMQLKDIKEQISMVNSAITRNIVSTVVSVAAIATVAVGGWWLIIAVVGALIQIWNTLQQMEEAADYYQFAKDLYEEYKDQFSVGPSFFVPEWLYDGMDDDDSNMGVLFTGLNRAMSGALNASNDNITNFLSQMFAILAISTSMQEARSIIISLLFGVSTGSQSKFVLSGFQAFGSYAMTMDSLRSQRAQLSMQVEKILTDALLNIQKAKDSMNTANKHGWISIGLSVISIVCSALQTIEKIAEFIQVLQAIVTILQALNSIMQSLAKVGDAEAHLERMQDTYEKMFGFNMEQLQAGGTNSALTSSAFELVNNHASGMIKPSAGGRVTYDPSVAAAARNAIKNWQRMWTAQIAIAQSVAEAKQSVMSMMFRTPSTVENFQLTAAVVQFQSQAMQIALSLAVALAKMQVSAWNAITAQQENIAAMEAANIVTFAFAALQMVGGVLQLGDAIKVDTGEFKVDATGAEVLDANGAKTPITEGLSTSMFSLDTVAGTFISTLLTGYEGGGISAGQNASETDVKAAAFKSVLTSVVAKLLRSIIQELLTEYMEKQAREDFRSSAEGKADKAFGKAANVENNKSWSNKVVSNAKVAETSSYNRQLSSRSKQMYDAMLQSAMSSLIDVMESAMVNIDAISSTSSSSPDAVDASPETAQPATTVNPATTVVSTTGGESVVVGDAPAMQAPAVQAPAVETPKDTNATTTPKADAMDFSKPLNRLRLSLIVSLVKSQVSEAISMRAKIAQQISSASTGTSQGANFVSAISGGMNANPTQHLQSAINQTIELVSNSYTNTKIADFLEDKFDFLKPTVDATADKPKQTQAQTSSEATAEFNDKAIAEALKDMKLTNEDKQIVKDAITSSSDANSVNIQQAAVKIADKIDSFKAANYKADVNDCDKVIALISAMQEVMQSLAVATKQDDMKMTDVSFVITQSADQAAAKTSHITAEFTHNNEKFQMDFSEKSGLKVENITGQPSSAVSASPDRVLNVDMNYSKGEVATKINTDHHSFAQNTNDDNVINLQGEKADMQVQVEATTKDNSQATEAAAAATAGAVAAGGATSLVDSAKADSSNKTPEAPVSGLNPEDIQSKTELTPEVMLSTIAQKLEDFNNQKARLVTSNPEKAKQEEAKVANDVVQLLESFSKTMHMSPDILQQVSKTDISSKESLEKLDSVVQKLIDASSKDPKVSDDIKSELANLQTAITAVSSKSEKNSNLAAIFNTTDSAQEKVEMLRAPEKQLTTMDIVRYVADNPAVMSLPVKGEKNREAVFSLILQEDSIEKKDVEQFNALSMKVVDSITNVVPDDKVVEEIASAMAQAPADKTEQTAARAIVMLEDMVQSNLISAEAVQSNVTQIVQQITNQSATEPVQQMAKVMQAVMQDPSIAPSVTELEEALSQTIVPKMIVEQMPEVLQAMDQNIQPTVAVTAPAPVMSAITSSEKVITEQLASMELTKEDTTVQSSAAAATSTQSVASPSNIVMDNIQTPLVSKAKTTDEVEQIKAKQDAIIVVQQLAAANEAIQVFHSPFADKSSSTPAQVQQQEAEAVAKVTAALENISKYISLSPELIQQVSKNDLSSKKSMETLAQAVAELTESVTKKSVATKTPISPKVQELLSELKNTVETISLTKTKNSQLAKVFNSSSQIQDKIDSLMELNNPLAVVKYAVDNPVVFEDSIIGQKNRVALISSMFMEDGIKAVDMAEFQTLFMKALSNVNDLVSAEQIIEDVVDAMTRAPGNLADSQIVKGLVLLEELAISGMVSEQEIKNILPELMDRIENAPDLRSSKEQAVIISSTLKFFVIPTINEVNVDETIASSKVIKQLFEEFPDKISRDDIAISSQSVSSNIVTSTSGGSLVSERAMSGFNREDVLGLEGQNAIRILQNINSNLNKVSDEQDLHSLLEKNISSFLAIGIITADNSFRTALKDFKENKLVRFDKFSEVMSLLEKNILNSSLGKEQKSALAELAANAVETSNFLNITKNKEQKAYEILSMSNNEMSFEDKLKELLKIKDSEVILSVFNNNPKLVQKNKDLIIKYLANNQSIKDVNSFAMLAKELLRKMNLNDIEKKDFVNNLLASITVSKTENISAVTQKTLILLDVLISLVKVDDSSIKQVVPTLVAKLRKESKPDQQRTVSAVIKNSSKLELKQEASNIFLQNFSDIVRGIGKSRISGLDVNLIQEKVQTNVPANISSTAIPVEVLAKDYTAIAEVFKRIKMNNSLLSDEKVIEYLEEYIMDFLSSSSWSKESMADFSKHLSNLLNMKPSIFSNLFEAINNGKLGPQERFASVLKMLSIYENKQVAQALNQKALSTLVDSYELSVQYLLISLPTLGAAVTDALGYMSDNTLKELRKRVQSELDKSGAVLKRGYELILKGIDQVEMARKGS